MNDYKSIYIRDYTPKSVEFYHPGPPIQEFHDPINEGFKQHLELDPPAIEPIELGDDYLLKFKENNPRLACKYFSTPIDKEEIRQDLLQRNATVYTKDYCVLGGSKNKDALHVVTLPDDAQLPASTYLSSFRDPVSLDSNALKKRTSIKPFISTDGDKKVNKILGIKTGETVYQKDFCELAQHIIEDQIYGKITH